MRYSSGYNDSFSSYSNMPNYGSKFSHSDNVVYDTLREMSALDEHVNFARKITEKYPWKVNVKKGFEARLKEIEDKQNDKCLNLSVIGEFSSGKSSFINALLGEDMLVSSVLQGTTVVNTLIEYSPKMVIEVTFVDGKDNFKLFPDKISDLREKLSYITTDNSSYARRIDMVKVGFPAELLKSGIRIIDTPGTNSLQSWHEEVTRRALRTISDVSVVLTDATHPLPETLLAFMDENIADLYAQCALVVTCIDLVPKKEHEGVLSYIKKKMSALPKGDRALVVPYCAPAVIGERKGEILIERKQEEMAEMSMESAVEIYHHLGHHRRIAQIKKLISLAGDLYNSLDGNMSKQAEALQKELNILKRSKKAPLSEFLKSQERCLTQKMIFEMSDLYKLLENDIKKTQAIITVSLNRSIKEQKTLEGIKGLMTNDFANKCKSECKIMEELSVKYGNFQIQIFEKYMQQFRRAFREEFENLRIFQMEISSKDLALPTLAIITPDSLSSVKNMVKEQVSKEDWSFWGGAAAGAVIGSMIAPGVGTVIGGILGFFGGGFMAPDTEKVKSDTISKAAPVIRNFLNILKDDILDKFEKNTDSLKREIELQLNAYLNRYFAEVQRRIQSQQAEYDNIEKKLSVVISDLDEINRHRQRLNSLRSAMN